MSAHDDAIAAGIRETVGSLEAELEATIALAPRLPANRVAAAARRLQHASHILAASLRRYMQETAFTIPAKDALEMMLAALDWWDTYDVEMYLAAGETLTTEQLRDVLVAGGGTWRDGMTIAEVRAECYRQLHTRRGK